jgi:hypothetical protein
MKMKQIFIIAIVIMTVATTAATTTTIQQAEAVGRSEVHCNPGSDSGSICILPESRSLIVPRACGSHSQTGSDGSFASRCSQGTSDSLTSSIGNNQYQGEEEEEYRDSRQSNEFRQGSQAYHQCIEAAADVGDRLSDYEIRNCQEDPSYRH